LVYNTHFEGTIDDGYGEGIGVGAVTWFTLTGK